MRHDVSVVLPFLLAACMTGPEDAASYRAEVFTLSAHFVTPPTDEASLSLERLSFSAEAQPSPTCGEAGRASARLVAGTAEFHVVAVPQGLGGYQCFSGAPEELRFFEATAHINLSEGPSSSAGPWTAPGYDLVYAPSPIRFSPFGPAEATVDFPVGYSWLRRRCSADGQIAMDVVPTSQMVEFQPSAPATPQSIGFDQSERLFVDGCGIAAPKEDLGVRICFDHAEAMAWSGDGSILYYLSVPDDPSASSGLRQVRLADSAVFELVVIPGARSLQTGAKDQIFVGGSGQWKVTPSPDGSATLERLALQSDAALSPDGRWLAYQDFGAGPASPANVRLWDTQANAEVATIPNAATPSWSPDSQLVFWTAEPSPRTLNRVSPQALDYPVAYPARDLPVASPMAIVWSADGPAVAEVPFDWSIESSRAWPECKSCFGLSTTNLATGEGRLILDASAGKITVVPTAASGFMLAWARTCLGRFNTVCTYSLLRIGLDNGTVQTVAVAENQGAVALSLDQTRVAIATPKGIYVKELPR